jgi:hypothetical protein
MGRYWLVAVWTRLSRFGRGIEEGKRKREEFVLI